MGPATISVESLPASERSIALEAYAPGPVRSSPSVELDESHGHAGDPLTAPDPAHSLVGGRLDAHHRRQAVGDVPLHLRSVRTDPRLLADHRGVNVHDPPVQVPERHGEEVERTRIAPPILVRREQRPEIALSG